MSHPTSTPPQDVHALCRRRLSEGDRADYYSALFAPPERRAASCALYAFWREVREVIDECSEPEIAQRKLDWWRDEVQAMFVGRPRHPVAVALAPALARHRLPEPAFLAILDALARHAQTPRYAGCDDLQRHAADTRGQLMYLAAVLGGYEDTATPEVAIALGAQQELTTILRNIGADTRRGRMYLPEQDLVRFGVRPEDVAAGREHEAWFRLMAFLTERTLTEIEKTRARLAPRDGVRQLPLLIGAELARVLLAEIRADGYRVLRQRIELTPLRQLWTAWRTARRVRRGARGSLFRGS